MEIACPSRPGHTRSESRKQLRIDREPVWDNLDIDSLPGEIADARAEMSATDEQLRLLPTCGHEFVEPRSYIVDALAWAAGMSASGV